MTKLMEKALEAVRDWPQDRQDEAAALLLALDRLGSTPYRATPDELEAMRCNKWRGASGPRKPKWKKPSRVSASESRL
jgi:hypothetical protein